MKTYMLMALDPVEEAGPGDFVLSGIVPAETLHNFSQLRPLGKEGPTSGLTACSFLH